MNACRAQAALAPNLTLLQNVQPKQRLAPLVDSLCCEVLGVPGVSHQSHSSPPALYPKPPHRYYFFFKHFLSVLLILNVCVDL